mgnify:FL=1
MISQNTTAVRGSHVGLSRRSASRIQLLEAAVSCCDLGIRMRQGEVQARQSVGAVEPIPNAGVWLNGGGRHVAHVAKIRRLRA